MNVDALGNLTAAGICADFSNATVYGAANVRYDLQRECALERTLGIVSCKKLREKNAGMVYDTNFGMNAYTESVNGTSVPQSYHNKFQDKEVCFDDIDDGTDSVLLR